jgi:anti-anti-sigma factor
MFESWVVGDVHVLTPRKNLVGGDETRALIDEVARLASQGTPKIVLNLQRVSWVSSLGIEALRRTHRVCAGQDGWVRLVYVGARIKSVLLTTRLHWVFETFDTVEEAVAAPAHLASPVSGGLDHGGEREFPVPAP